MPANICCQRFERSAAFLSLFQLIFRPVELTVLFNRKNAAFAIYPRMWGTNQTLRCPFAAPGHGGGVLVTFTSQNPDMRVRLVCGETKCLVL